MGIPTFPGNTSEEGSRGSLWKEPGEGTQRGPEMDPSGCEQIPTTDLEEKAHFSILMGVKKALQGDPGL